MYECGVSACGEPGKRPRRAHAHHFWMRIFSGRVPAWCGVREAQNATLCLRAPKEPRAAACVPACAATSFFRSPMVSSSLTRQGRGACQPQTLTAQQPCLCVATRHALALDANLLALWKKSKSAPPGASAPRRCVDVRSATHAAAQAACCARTRRSFSTTFSAAGAEQRVSSRAYAHCTAAAPRGCKQSHAAR